MLSRWAGTGGVGFTPHVILVKPGEVKKFAFFRVYYVAVEFDLMLFFFL